MCSGASAELARNGRLRRMRVVAMASQITVNVSLSSLQWSVTRANGDKLVMVINVVEGKQHPFSGSLICTLRGCVTHEDSACQHLFTPLQLCSKANTKFNTVSLVAYMFPVGKKKRINTLELCQRLCGVIL